MKKNIISIMMIFLLETCNKIKITNILIMKRNKEDWI
jgi:hypothetical protein